jgi:hypothetical protein
MIGLALLTGLSFIGYHNHGRAFGAPTIEPGPWLLGGLIPTFVGSRKSWWPCSRERASRRRRSSAARSRRPGESEEERTDPLLGA